MPQKIVCPQCKAVCEFNTKSVWEGNRDFEEYLCPDCGCVLATAFTDQIPNIKIIKHGKINNNSHKDT